MFVARIHFSIALIGSLLPSTSLAQRLEDADYAKPGYSSRFVRGSMTPLVAPGKVIHVSAESGKDSNPGTADAPLRSLDAARDAVRLHHGKLPSGGIEVRIGPGIYRLSKSLTFGPEDSGTREAPIVWRGADRSKVILSGGTLLDSTDFQKADSAELDPQLHPDARGKLWSIVVTGKAGDDLRSTDGKSRFISMDGHMLGVARWPNTGYHHIGEILDPGPATRHLPPGKKPPEYSRENPTGGRFRFRETLSTAVNDEFLRTGRMWVEGYPHNDWYFQREPVGRIEDGTVQLLRHTRYCVEDHIKSMPRRVRLVNVLAELDQPGEWYFDEKGGRLIVWPTPGFDPSKSRVTIPEGPPLVALRNTSHLTLRDLTFENTGDVAITIDGGHQNLIAASTIRNGLGRGVRIEGGTRNGITGCDFHDLFSAFSIRGGDFKSLERCYHFATNNRIHDCRLRGYGVVGLDGVGLRFAHNLLHDMNGAVSFKTADLLMEYNEFFNIGYEMGDFNVAYTGAQWHTMGNVLRYNFVHHLLEPGGHPVCPFRNDDGGAGLKIFGNVFYRAGRCAAQFHGPANTLQNNISLEAPVFWWTLKRPITEAGVSREWDDLARFGRDLPKGDKGDFLHNLESRIGEDAWNRSPWQDQYPELRRFIRSNPFAQTLCCVERNYASGCREPFHIHGGDGTVRGMEDKRTGTFADLPKEGVFELPHPITLDAFRDIEALDFRFAAGFSPMEGFAPIPFDRIGLRKDSFRTSVPDRTTYRSATYEKFEKDRGGRYQPEKVNARYPTPSYLR
ncbi:hypothetical protein HAHE_00950 [Haloferula helveola]|uniref:Right handed beta helix domain-containing protein n=2 Tax=Haloferula helveola TaxID=490095 RepID=A0ABM7R8F2_9BACT|nr:hypothetical protein HAHE_00950 [Haloferula helveola]